MITKEMCDLLTQGADEERRRQAVRGGTVEGDDVRDGIGAGSDGCGGNSRSRGGWLRVKEIQEEVSMFYSYHGLNPWLNVSKHAPG